MSDMPNIDIRPDHWEIVRDILHRHVPHYAVWAFGSRAKWQAKQYSDLDLVVITDQPLSLAVSAALADDFSESDLPWKVDVVDWAATGESFRKIIERNRVVVQLPRCELVVTSQWRDTTIGEAFEVNPIRRVERGKVTPFLPMDLLPVNGRSPEGIEQREFTGSGIKFKNGDTLIARITPCLENGKTAFISGLQGGEIAHGSTEYIVLGGKPDQSDGLFAYYMARSPDFRRYAIGLMEGTSGRQRVPSAAVKKYPLALPPVSEQQVIARILGALDDKIELNRRMNQTLEAMARALFKSWFVDFDGVSPEDMQESELGLIPKGWNWVPASALIEFNPTEPLRKGTLAPYLDMAALPTVGSWPEQPVLREFASGMRFRNRDSLLARITPCLENGKTAFVQCLPENTCAWGSTEFIVMRPKAPFSAEYVYLLARDDAFRAHAIQSMTGTSGRQRVQADSVAAFKVAAPSDKNIWKNFSDFVAPIFTSIKSNSEASETLAHLRDTLLPKLISGELRVRDAEKITETA